MEPHATSPSRTTETDRAQGQEQETFGEHHREVLPGDRDGSLTARLEAVTASYPALFRSLVKQAAALMDRSRTSGAAHGYVPEEAVQFALRPRSNVPEDVRQLAIDFLEYLGEDAGEDTPESTSSQLSLAELTPVDGEQA